MLTELAALNLKKAEQAKILQTAEALFFKTRMRLSHNTVFKDELSFKYLCALTAGPLIDVRVGMKAEEKGYEKCVVNVGRTDGTLGVCFTTYNPDLSLRASYGIDITLNTNDWSHESAEITYEDFAIKERLNGIAAAAKFEELLEKIK